MDYTKSNVSRIFFVVIGVLIGITLVWFLFNSTGQNTTPSHKTSQSSSDTSASQSPTMTTKNTGLANPASVYCQEQGGQTIIQTRSDGGQYGLCDFGSGMSCEEWAMYRKECPIGGIRTTGYDTIEQKYCAWSGGSTLAEPNATCTFKNGKACSVDSFYNGTCSMN